jgi:hypothetical protein
MTVDITAARPFPGSTRCRTIAFFALTGIGLGLAAVPASTLGADLSTGYRVAMIPRSAPALAERHPLLEPTSDTPDVQRRSFMDARTVDRLYRELMRSSACALGSGHCSE